MKTNSLFAALAAGSVSLMTGCAQAPVAQAPDSPPPGTVAAAPVNLSAGAAEVVRLAEAGTGDDVMLAYIQNANSPFGLTADQILYLRDIGVSQPAITAMLNRDNVLRNQPQTYAYNQTAYPATVPPPAPETPAPAPSVEPPLTPAVQPAPVYVSSPPPEVTYFYNDLSPYGTWVTLEGVGWCWQPRVLVVNRAWRPYCDGGHWVWTDCGWFWQSDYSWGWAPFHYGRWYLHDRCGWVWLPDRVWGPSWVVWRSEGSYCGWAPLPPHADFDIRLGWRFNGVRVGVKFDFGLRPDCYSFVGFRDFDRHDLGARRLRPTEVTRIYNQTTIINNYVVNNNTVVNRGVQVERVRSETRAPMRELAVRDAPGRSPEVRGVHADRGEVAVYRPELKAPARPEKMVAQKVDNRHPTIQHEPVAPMNVQRPTVSGAKAPVAATSPRAVSSETRQPAPQASYDRRPAAASRSQTYSAPKASQPAPAPRVSEKPAQVARPAAAVAPAPAPRAESVASRPTAPPQSSRAPAVAKPDEPGRLYPLRAGENPRPGASSTAPGHIYEPKSYHQAAEAHALPPLPKARKQDDSSAQPSKSSNGKGRRNEQ